MVNYDNSTIYKLCCKDTEIKDEYVGSTTAFRKRKNQHKTRCSNVNDMNYNVFVYQFIRENGGWNNWEMIEVEKYCATDKQDLHKRERYWCEELGASLNTNVPSRSITEWYKDNKENVLQKQKQYRESNYQRIALRRESNKDKYALTMKHYYEANKEALLQMNKQYRTNNKEYIAQQRKDYRNANKEIISQKQKELYKNKVKCECGSLVGKYSLPRHRKTAKHKKLMESLT